MKLSSDVNPVKFHALEGVVPPQRPKPSVEERTTIAAGETERSDKALDAYKHLDVFSLRQWILKHYGVRVAVGQHTLADGSVVGAGLAPSDRVSAELPAELIGRARAARLQVDEPLLGKPRVSVANTAHGARQLLELFKSHEGVFAPRLQAGFHLTDILAGTPAPTLGEDFFVEWFGKRPPPGLGPVHPEQITARLDPMGLIEREYAALVAREPSNVLHVQGPGGRSSFALVPMDKDAAFRVRAAGVPVFAQLDGSYRAMFPNTEAGGKAYAGVSTIDNPDGITAAGGFISRRLEAQVSPEFLRGVRGQNKQTAIVTAFNIMQELAEALAVFGRGGGRPVRLGASDGQRRHGLQGQYPLGNAQRVPHANDGSGKAALQNSNLNSGPLFRGDGAARIDSNGGANAPSTPIDRALPPPRIDRPQLEQFFSKLPPDARKVAVEHVLGLSPEDALSLVQQVSKDPKPFYDRVRQTVLTARPVHAVVQDAVDGSPAVPQLLKALYAQAITEQIRMRYGAKANGADAAQFLRNLAAQPGSEVNRLITARAHQLHTEQLPRADQVKAFAAGVKLADPAQRPHLEQAILNKLASSGIPDKAPDTAAFLRRLTPESLSWKAIVAETNRLFQDGRTASGSTEAQATRSTPRQWETGPSSLPQIQASSVANKLGPASIETAQLPTLPDNPRRLLPESTHRPTDIKNGNGDLVGRIQDGNDGSTTITVPIPEGSNNHVVIYSGHAKEGVVDTGTPERSSAAGSDTARSTNESDWANYYAVTADNPPSLLLADGLRHYLQNGQPVGRFLDLGSGAGNETLQMLKLGWPVTAVDPQASALQFLNNRLPTDHRSRLTTIESTIEAAELPVGVDVIFSGRTMPHVPADQLPMVLEKASRSLRAGGYFIADFFTPDHPLANQINASFLDEQQVRAVLPTSLEVVRITNDDGVIGLIARKRGNDVRSDAPVKAAGH